MPAKKDVEAPKVSTMGEYLAANGGKRPVATPAGGDHKVSTVGEQAAQAKAPAEKKKVSKSEG